MKRQKLISKILIGLFLLNFPSISFASEWVLQTGTKLEEAGSNFDFCLGDYNSDGKLDLYALKKSSTGSITTEVHIMNGANNFQSFLLQTATKLEEAGTKFDFCLGDYNGDGKLDLYALKKSSTGSRTTEIHILNGANNFQNFLLQTATKLEEAGTKFDFCLGDYNGDGKLDLYALKKSSTGSRTTEIHILNGANNFQSFLLQTATKLEEAGTKFDFCLGDYNRDGKLDLYALKKSSTGSKSTEVHILTIDGTQGSSSVNTNITNSTPTSSKGLTDNTMFAIANKIGTQVQYKYPKSNVMCTAFSMAYCRAYLFNDYREPTAYWKNGTGAMWSWGKGIKKSYRSNSQVLAAIKSQIDAGKPCIVRVDSSREGHCIVAFKYSGSGTSTSDFTIIDPWSAKIKTLNNYTIHSTTKYIVTF